MRYLLIYKEEKKEYQLGKDLLSLAYSSIFRKLSPSD